jgi:hypothetical protein
VQQPGCCGSRYPATEHNRDHDGNSDDNSRSWGGPTTSLKAVLNHLIDRGVRVNAMVQLGAGISQKRVEVHRRPIQFVN